MGAPPRLSQPLLDIPLGPVRPSLAFRVARWLFEPRAIGPTEWRAFLGCCGLWAVIMAWAVFG